MARTAVRPWVGRWAAASVAVAWAAVASPTWLAAAAPAAPPAPVVPGFDRLTTEGKADAVAAGQLLLGELNCTSCHQAETTRVQPRPAPDLSAAGARITPGFLRAYLSDPQAAKPGTVMPNVFHASAPQMKAGAVEALTHYLASLGGPVKPSGMAGTTLDVVAGEKLFHTVGCVACHAPRGKQANDKDGQPIPLKIPSVPLPDLARKTTADQLAAFLKEPHTIRPSGRMPSLNLSTAEAKSLAVYLLKDQLENPQATDAAPVAARGLTLTYWEAKVADAKLETFDKLKAKPKFTGTTTKLSADVPGARKGNWAAKFAGTIEIPKTGKYTFYVASDDGARIYVDGKEVVENDGIHPANERKGQPVELKAGPRPFVLTFFQEGGGAELRVEWQGPGIKKSEIPPEVLSSADAKPMVPLDPEPTFAVDPDKAGLGRQMFSMLGCAACHQVEGQKSMRPYKPLAGLNVDNPEGCLGDRIRKAVPNYALSDAQQTALKAAVADAGSLGKPLDAKEQVSRTMAALNCYACHKRDGVGGPHEDRAGYFTMTSDFDMGDEGRIPPVLTNVGGKLRPEAFEQIVCEAKLHVRPALATRMPRFEKAAVAGLLTSVAAADAPNDDPKAGPAFAEQPAKDGRTLVGIRGLGCVNCHGVVGVKSLGMPAPDLTTSHERLRHKWYSQLMHDPNSVNPGTRMPAFWPDNAVMIQNVGAPTGSGGTGGGASGNGGGAVTAQSQIDAIYTYLSLGKSMGLPAGLAPSGKSELTPAEEPILHRTFFQDVGPRTVLVGYPEQLSVAFDANLVRLAVVWRGRFFDSKGIWDGRGGEALGPLGTDVLKLPAAGTFAVLPSATAAWPKYEPRPEDGKFARNPDAQFLGYDLDKERRPTFRYRVAGVEVREQPLPKVQPGGARLVRRFNVGGGAGGNGAAGGGTAGGSGSAGGGATAKVETLYLLAVAGKTVEETSRGVWTVDGKVTIRVLPPAGGAASAPLPKGVVADDAGGKQLRFAVPTGGESTFDLDVAW
jgi:mono/diheme cytochrome c family protein